MQSVTARSWRIYQHSGVTKAARLSLFVATFGLGALNACGGDEETEPMGGDASTPAGDSGTSTSTTIPTTTDAQTPVDAAPPEPVVTEYTIAAGFEGNYVSKITLRKIYSASILGTLDSLVTFYALVEIRADESAQEVWFDLQYCHAELEGEGTFLLMNSGLVTPDVVMTTTEVDPVPFSANMNALGQTVWSVPEVIGNVGWMSSGPSDSIPTEATDPRVFDQDSDGEVGVTTQVTLSGTPFDVYGVQRLRDLYAGSANADGSLRGTVVDRTEQYVLDSPNDLLASAQLEEMPSPDTSDNVIVLQPVTEVPSCAGLTANADTYFP